MRLRLESGRHYKRDRLCTWDSTNSYGLFVCQHFDQQKQQYTHCITCMCIHIRVCVCIYHINVTFWSRKKQLPASPASHIKLKTHYFEKEIVCVACWQNEKTNTSFVLSIRWNHRSLLQKRPIIFRSLLIVATPQESANAHISMHNSNWTH